MSVWRCRNGSQSQEQTEKRKHAGPVQTDVFEEGDAETAEIGKEANSDRSA